MSICSIDMQQHSQYAVALASIACVEILLSSVSVSVDADMMADLLEYLIIEDLNCSFAWERRYRTA